MARTPRRTAHFPSQEDILRFIDESPVPAGKREISRAFGLHGADKIALKALLKDMANDGLIATGQSRAFHRVGGLPKVAVLKVIDVDDSGQTIALPETWEGEGPSPHIRVIEKVRRGALGPGDRLLARIEPRGKGHVAHVLKKLTPQHDLSLGVLRKEGDRLWLRPIDKKERRELAVSDAGDAEPGELVLVEKGGRPPRITARVVERLGDPFQPRSFSLIAIHQKGIPDQFDEDTIVEAEQSAKQPLGDRREDLRHLPFAAIDPEDARDHDDAIWATADDDAANPGGWIIAVAIADVSFYVRPGTKLDKAAKARGNSVYFPDRVVPMLPEALSSDSCSLKEGEDRAALVCFITIDKAGLPKSWRFIRATIRCIANIAYENAQAAIDENRDDALTQSVLKPLWGAWKALSTARAKREPLDLDLPERRIIIDSEGRIASIAPRERLDAHRLIEDYMIAANVAAAKSLEAKKAPVVYRTHEPPGREKLAALKDYLETFEIAFALGSVIKPSTFNHIIARVGDSDFRPQIMEQILRTQTQAYYGADNHGHFGLSLGSYAHFTSPIRRYSDLFVHRSLVRAYDLGPGGLTDEEVAAVARTAEHISMTERRAMEAERDTTDRYVAAYLAQHVGQVLETRITGVTNFGFFATVEGIGGDGLVPVSTLGDEHFHFDEATQALEGELSGTRYVTGMALPLRLAEANPVSGALRFALEEASSHFRTSARQKKRAMQGKRGRPPGIRHKGRRK